MASLELPLHHYPTHALSVLSSDLSLLPTLMSWEHSKKTYRFQQFALAHSRMVLVLQNLVHSTTEPISSELNNSNEELEQWFSKSKSKVNGVAKKANKVYSQKGGLRELTFPKPLSYAPSSFPNSPMDDSPAGKSSPSSMNGHGFGSSSSSATSSENGNSPLEGSKQQQRLRHGRKWASEDVRSAPESPTVLLPKARSSAFLSSSVNSRAERSASSSSLVNYSKASPSASKQRKSNRLSIFASVKGRSTAPLPKPEEEPESLRIYSGNWRKGKSSYSSQSSRYSFASNGHGLKMQNRNRESTQLTSYSRTRSDSISGVSNSQSCEQGIMSELHVEDEELQPPRRRFVIDDGDRRGSSSSPSRSSAGTSRHSSSSSLGSAVSVGQGPVSRSPSRFAVRGSPLGMGGVMSSGRSDERSTVRGGKERDLHDLKLATVRSRAPILRVFVPCSSLGSRSPMRMAWNWRDGEDEVDDVTIASIENELVDAGLWEHLSVGDVVCNLGYVPLEREVERGQEEEDASNYNGDPESEVLQGSEREGRRWLVYTGQRLIVYDPAISVESGSSEGRRPDVGIVPLRGEEVIGLPSPFYFSHLASMHTGINSGAGLNTVFRLPVSLLKFLAVRSNQQLNGDAVDGRVRRGTGEDNVKYWLQETTVRVRSRAGYGMQGQGKTKYGYVSVRTYAWLVSFEVTPSAALNMGSGWAGEWVIQSEGTPEGRARLEEAVFGTSDSKDRNEDDKDKDKGYEKREAVVEIVREKCGNGKLYLRLIYIRGGKNAAHSPSLEDHFGENTGLDVDFGIVQ